METNISRVKELISLIGKCDLEYDFELKLYSLNDFEINRINENFYSNLKTEFVEKLILQLANKKLDKKILTELINNTNSFLEDVKLKKDNLRVSFLLDKSKGKLAEETISNQEYIHSILEAQFTTLNNVNRVLLNIFEELDYILDEELAELKSKTSLYESSSENVKLPKIGKAQINLRKKDAISLILLLEVMEILDFSDTDRIKFIENNFNYKNNNGETKSINQINSEISNLKDIKVYGSRNVSSFKRLIEKITLGLESFDFKQFASKLK